MGNWCDFTLLVGVIILYKWPRGPPMTFRKVILNIFNLQGQKNNETAKKHQDFG